MKTMKNHLNFVFNIQMNILEKITRYTFFSFRRLIKLFQASALLQQFKKKMTEADIFLSLSLYRSRSPKGRAWWHTVSISCWCLADHVVRQEDAAPREAASDRRPLVAEHFSVSLSLTDWQNDPGSRWSAPLLGDERPRSSLSADCAQRTRKLTEAIGQSRIRNYGTPYVCELLRRGCKTLYAMALLYTWTLGKF